MGKGEFRFRPDPCNNALVFGVFDGVSGQKLQGDGPFQREVLGLVHDTHTAFTELLGDLVVADGLGRSRQLDSTPKK